MVQEMAGFEGMDRMGSRALKQQQEQLIYNLKVQIEGLDQQTQGQLKDTLYRISRNANTAVSTLFRSTSSVDRVAAL